MKSKLFVVMGVSGCGKTTLAEELAQKTGGLCIDADDFHSPANKEKMASGTPLNDGDRAGWLDTLNGELKKAAGGEKPFFLACSALKEAYRAKLRAGLEQLNFIYLHGTKEFIGNRLANRKGHFMPTSLLDSQFATLEEPKDAFVVEISSELDDKIKSVLAAFPELGK